MSDLIQSIAPGNFPFARPSRRDVNERKRDKSEFARWLANKSVNSNNAEAPAMPMLSMEDELMLAKLRELARPFPATRSYKQINEDGTDANGQYMLDFMVNPHVDERI